MTRTARFRRNAGITAVIGTAFSIFGFLADKKQFLVAYLEGYLMWLGITLGCLALWMIHNLVGGQWGDPIGRVVRAAVRTLPLLTLLFLPILLGIGDLFPWASPRFVNDPMIADKRWYLNSSFFLGRALFFFCLWWWLVRGLTDRSEKAGNDLASRETRRLQGWSGGGAVLLFFSASFAVVDWILSADPYYYSTIFPPLCLMGQLLGAFAFCTLSGIVLHSADKHEIPEQKLNDLGNLLLTSVILWMYMTFSQYLITWSGQMKQEVSWYNARFMGGWEWLGVLLLGLNFALPFSCLLFRAVKRRPRRLSAVCALILLMQWVDANWLVGPTFSPMAISMSWQNAVVPFALGAVWLTAFAWHLERGTAGFARGHLPEVARYAA
jgi:hypothetical protein